MRKSLSVLGYITFLVLFCSLVLETALRFDLVTLKFEGKGKTILTLDKKLLYKLVPDPQKGINRQGYRSPFDFTHTKDNRKRILFYGDSIVFGIGVKSTDTLPFHLDNLLGSGAEVYNMAMYGYGPDQSFMQLMEDGLSYSPDIVILGLSPQNDFDDIRKNRLMSLNEDGRAVYNQDNIVTRLMGPLELTYLYKYIRYRAGLPPGGPVEATPVNYTYSREDFTSTFKALFQDGTDKDFSTQEGWMRLEQNIKLMVGILRSFKAELDSRGIPLVVVIVPSYQSTQGVGRIDIDNKEELMRHFAPQSMAEALCRNTGINVINLFESFVNEKHPTRLYLEEQDAHFSAYGNQYAAGQIMAHLERTGLLAQPRKDR